MGWTINYATLRSPHDLDAFLQVVGRALYIATEFERKCKSVLGVTHIVDSYALTGDASASFALAEAVQKRLLHPVIRDLGKRLEPDPGDVELLERAREARNFIAHEAASCFTNNRDGELERLRLEVRALAAGDNVVSRWVYEIAEKEAAPSAIQQRYVDWVEQWVFDEPDGD